MGQAATLWPDDEALHAADPVALETRHNQDSYYGTLVQNKSIAYISSLTLECGITLHSVPIVYSTWGTLNKDLDNVLVVCHALTGSSDAMDWWRPLFGHDKALDPPRYFIFCANIMGSPYGSASPLSTNPATGSHYGPTFPHTSIRDDVRAHKLVLDALGVRSVAAVIGGSMGGMAALEWPLCTPLGYLKNIIPIATSAYHGAWGISWGETQRQAIFADAVFKDGWYEPTPQGQPRAGLGTARMIAMLTYRSHGSFESRFSRKPATTRKVSGAGPPPVPASLPENFESGDNGIHVHRSTPTFSAQSYLHYQADKFLDRFDANCYIHITKKMDTHDVTRDRILSPTSSSYPVNEADLREVLRSVPPKALVIGVDTDVLFRPEQQEELLRCLPDARMVKLDSLDGHDGFLLEFETLDKVIKEHLEERCPRMYEARLDRELVDEKDGVITSVFGEVDPVEF